MAVIRYEQDVPCTSQMAGSSEWFYFGATQNFHVIPCAIPGRGEVADNGRGSATVQVHL